MPTLKNKLKFFLRNFGIDIGKYNLSECDDFRLNHFLKINDIDCVLDVGANIGQYAYNLRRIGYKKNIISFEPMLSAYKILQNKSAKDKLWTSYNFGIGEKDKEVDINISENSYSSSILDIMPLHTETEPESKYFSSETIAIKKLENVTEINNEKLNKIFLKIDTQGYEAQVLQGIGKLLDKIEGIQIELSLYPLYKDQCLFFELHEKIKELGFELWDIQRGFSNTKSGKIYQLDGIFFKIKNFIIKKD
jgi:FkbM family methyltransferase